jgi:hypothetical protein
LVNASSASVYSPTIGFVPVDAAWIGPGELRSNEWRREGRTFLLLPNREGLAPSDPPHPHAEEVRPLAVLKKEGQRPAIARTLSA